MLLTGICTIVGEISAIIVVLRALEDRNDQLFSYNGDNRGLDLLSFTTYPIIPITTNPIPTAWLILRNSRLSGFWQRLISILPSLLIYVSQNMSRNILKRSK